MSAVLENFPGAQRALKRAEWMARRRESPLVEPLDLLAALTVESESRAAELLMEFGVEISGLEAMKDLPPDVRAAVRDAAQRALRHYLD